MMEVDAETLLRWEQLATEFGRLHDQAPSLCLHAEHSGGFREDRKAELRRRSPAVRLIDGKGGWLWWLDGDESSVDETAVAKFLELADESGTLKGRTKSQVKLIAGKWERLSPGVRNISATAEWLSHLFDKARGTEVTFPTRRGDCIRDAVGSSRQACDMTIARQTRAGIAEEDREFKLRMIERRLRSADSRPLQYLDFNADTLADLFPKATPNSMTDRAAVPFTTIADELWQCWDSVLFGIVARLSKLDDEQQKDWLAKSYWPELAGCLKRTWLHLPSDVDFVDCSTDERTALRDLKQLVNRLWRTVGCFWVKQSVGILESDDEARFGKLVATFDRLQSQAKIPPPPAGGVLTEYPPPTQTVADDSGMTKIAGKRFRIALSFPGAKREFVAAVAEHLAAKVGRDRVLYDKWHEAEFARPRLAEHLPPLYREQSELIAAFLCADYRNSEWCGLEWDAILDLIKKREDDAIMLLRFDDTEIAGLYSTHGYAWIAERSAAEIAELILTRWRQCGTT